MAKRPTDDQEVPDIAPKQLMMMDPRIPIFQGEVPNPKVANGIPLENSLGQYQVIQEDSNGQGYYMEILSGTFGGRALVKYYGKTTDRLNLTLLGLYSGLGLSPEVAVEHRKCEEVKNTEREIIFASQLKHPNVAKILAYISPSGERGDINAIIMEGASLGTLENYAKKAQIPDTCIKLYGFQLADALRYCHDELHILHRDVRPRNIYVHDNGRTVKIGNFGYARVDNETEKTANKGDEVDYKAPEIIYGGSVTAYSYPVDVYSYGLVLWSICHQGRKPFENRFGSSRPNHFMFRRYLEESNDNRPPIREDLDAGLTNLIRNCWVNLEGGFNKRPAMRDIALFLRFFVVNKDLL